MNIINHKLRSSRQSYATQVNAETTLRNACEKLCVPFEHVRYLIAVTDTNRYVPVVIVSPNLPNHGLDFAMHFNITVVG